MILIGKRSFTSGLLPALGGGLLIALLALLGLWQLHRADEKTALQASVEARALAVPMDLNHLGTSPDDLSSAAWRHVAVHGKWDGAHQVLLDNQILDGQAGYFVYTPLRIEGCSCAVLVNRGWISSGASRASIPDIGIEALTVEASGIAAPPPSSGFGARDDWEEMVSQRVVRVQRLDVAGVSRWLGVRLLPLTLRLDPSEPNGYKRKRAPPAVNAERHFAYAAQWFLLAILAAVYLVRVMPWRAKGATEAASPPPCDAR